MEADEFEVRKQELISECTVPPQVFERVMPRLEQFMAPFVERLFRKEQVEHANMFVQGLLSSLERKNAESIAYLFGQERMPLQHFLGISEWDDKPLREELARQIGQQLGEAGGVIVFDPSAFPKSGNNSVGVKRQWCGRLGKIENCQVGVYIGYASSREHALVDMRLYLPLEWAKDWKRRKQAGIPKEIRYRTRHELCLEMLAEHGEQLPHQWITGDDEMGRPYRFRRRLDLLGEQYLPAVPCNTTVRDLEVDPPAEPCSRVADNRANSLFIELLFEEHRVKNDKVSAAHNAANEISWTKIKITVGPRSNRDRRRNEELDNRARELLTSFRAYLMTVEESEMAPSGTFKRIKRIIAPWLTRQQP